MTVSNFKVDQQRVIAVSDQEVVAMSAGDIDQFLRILTDDAVLMPPNLPPKTGEELRNWMRDFFERFTIEWLGFAHLETEVAGDLAYHVYAYSWRVTPKAGGEPIVAHGKGMHILRRQTDGCWKLTREIWNASPRVPQTP
jgi:ketosteroid isomerase-like protein